MSSIEVLSLAGHTRLVNNLIYYFYFWNVELKSFIYVFSLKVFKLLVLAVN